MKLYHYLLTTILQGEKMGKIGRTCALIVFSLAFCLNSLLIVPKCYAGKCGEIKSAVQATFKNMRVTEQRIAHYEDEIQKNRERFNNNRINKKQYKATLKNYNKKIKELNNKLRKQNNHIDKLKNELNRRNCN